MSTATAIIRLKYYTPEVSSAPKKTDLIKRNVFSAAKIVVGLQIIHYVNEWVRFKKTGKSRSLSQTLKTTRRERYSQEVKIELMTRSRISWKYSEPASEGINDQIIDEKEQWAQSGKYIVPLSVQLYCSIYLLWCLPFAIISKFNTARKSVSWDSFRDGFCPQK